MGICICTGKSYEREKLYAFLYTWHVLLLCFITLFAYICELDLFLFLSWGSFISELSLFLFLNCFFFNLRAGFVFISELVFFISELGLFISLRWLFLIISEPSWEKRGFTSVRCKCRLLLRWDGKMAEVSAEVSLTKRSTNLYGQPDYQRPMQRTFRVSYLHKSYTMIGKVGSYPQWQEIIKAWFAVLCSFNLGLSVMCQNRFRQECF